VTTVEVKLGPVQREIVRAIRQPTCRFLDIEGALRSAKTWTILIAIRTLLEDYPGIVWTMSRWLEGDLLQKLIPDYRHVCELMGISHGTWVTDERCFDFPNGSRLYAVHLKAGAAENKFSKVRGLTTAGFYINQLEEVPEDVYQEAALRLSQPGYPQLMVVDPNAIPENHWIAKKWPATQANPQHRYIRVAMRDNAHNLDAVTIDAAETLYPIGHPLRAIKIEGRRGLEVSGTPVYSGAFDKRRHVAADRIALNPELPLLELYDYGFHHPCVLFGQYAPWGHLRVLGGVMGSDLHLDAFLPIVERYRSLWFPDRKRIDACGDPAGAANNSQGLRGTPLGMLQDWYREHGERDELGNYVCPTYQPDANHPERRSAANQKAATYMRRRVNGVEAFQVDPERWVLAELKSERFDNFFIDGLEAGYVLEEKSRHSSTLGTFSVPKKDGWFEHAQNCFEYGLQAYVSDLPMGNEHAEETKLRHELKQVKADHRALRKLQHDRDPDDRRLGYRQTSRRGGY
jgi:hypothetical protein